MSIWSTWMMINVSADRIENVLTEALNYIVGHTANAGTYKDTKVLINNLSELRDDFKRIRQQNSVNIK